MCTWCGVGSTPHFHQHKIITTINQWAWAPCNLEEQWESEIRMNYPVLLVLGTCVTCWIGLPQTLCVQIQLKIYYSFIITAGVIYVFIVFRTITCQTVCSWTFSPPHDWLALCLSYHETMGVTLTQTCKSFWTADSVTSWLINITGIMSLERILVAEGFNCLTVTAISQIVYTVCSCDPSLHMTPTTAAAHTETKKSQVQSANRELEQSTLTKVCCVYSKWGDSFKKWIEIYSFSYISDI